MQNRSTAVLQCANILKKRTLLALLHLFEHTTLYILQQLYQNLCGMMKKRIEAVVSKVSKLPKARDKIHRVGLCQYSISLLLQHRDKRA
jgi:hypothetical protein